MSNKVQWQSDMPCPIAVRRATLNFSQGGQVGMGPEGRTPRPAGLLWGLCDGSSAESCALIAWPRGAWLKGVALRWHRLGQGHGGCHTRQIMSPPGTSLSCKWLEEPMMSSEEPKRKPRPCDTGGHLPQPRPPSYGTERGRKQPQNKGVYAKGTELL